MPDPTDPRAVADDPSGIVQQTPEGLIAWRASIEAAARHSWSKRDLLADADIARATEADLRAEVERLRAQVKQKNAALRRSEAFVEKGMDRVGPLLREIRAALSPETDGGQDG